MPRLKQINEPGRPKGRSGLPELKPGQPFSLIGVLRCCTHMLSVKDVAAILDVPVSTVYAQINAGKLPVPDLGFDIVRVDPAQWVRELEHKNPHLVASARQYQAA